MSSQQRAQPAIEIEVVCVRYENGDKSRAISHVGLHVNNEQIKRFLWPPDKKAESNRIVAGIPCMCKGCPDDVYRVTAAEAVALIEGGAELFTLDANRAKPAKVIVVDVDNGNGIYIKTVGDAVGSNNLASKHECVDIDASPV